MKTTALKRVEELEEKDFIVGGTRLAHIKLRAALRRINDLISLVLELEERANTAEKRLRTVVERLRERDLL